MAFGDPETASFEGLAEHAPVGIFVTDERGSCRFVNRVWCELTGLDAVSAMGHGWAAALHPDDAARVGEAWSAATSAGRAFRLEYRFLRPDGSTTWVLGGSAAIRDQKGGVCAHVGTVTDITPSKALEEELQRTQSRLQATLDATTMVGIVATQADGTITLLNQGAERLLGRTSSDVVGRVRIHELALLGGIDPRVAALAAQPEESAALLARVLRRAIARGCEEQFRRIVRPDGESLPVHIAITASRRPGGETDGYVFVVTDRSEHEQAELEQRQAKEAAERSNQAKSAFLANVSHELRTPMNGVLGLLALALEESSEPRITARLALIQESARALVTIVDGLLDFSKIESGQLGLDLGATELRAEVEQVTELMRATAEGKGLRFMWSVGASVPAVLEADGLRLRQVLLNLIDNAIKFTDEGAVLVRVTASPGDEGMHHVRFEVSDSGVGIAEGELARIFRPFEQLDPSATRRFGGTGLGLSISAALVQMMGGRIEAESTLGQGSTMSFVLPLRESGGRADVADVADVLQSRRELRVLLAEDNPINQLVAVGMLERAGHEVWVASDGLQAVRLAGEGVFDVILMDIQMPNLDGYGAAAAIRAAEAARGSRTPIVALTAHASREDCDRSLQAGMDAHVVKPLDGPSLLGLLERLTERKQRRRSVAPPASNIADAALQREAAALLLEEHPRLVERLRAALRNGDAEALARVAHRVIGSAGQLGGTELVSLARPLMAAGRVAEGTDARVGHLIESLDALASRLRLVVAAGSAVSPGA
jgi:PAS domain S-box-containing protein